jgi:hypothetical protein
MLKQVQHDIFLCFPLYDTVSEGEGYREGDIFILIDGCFQRHVEPHRLSSCLRAEVRFSTQAWYLS